MRRGFRVLLPDGRHGWLEDIRLGEDAVELVVTTGLFVHRRLVVGASEIESIVPSSSRIVLRAKTPQPAAGARDVGAVARMPGRNVSPCASPPKEAA